MLAVVASVASCDASHSTGNVTAGTSASGSPSPPELSLQARILEFANVTPGVVAEWDTAIREENVLTAACVKRETGLQPPVDNGRLPAYWEGGASLQWQQLTAAQARRRGFGVWLKYVTQPPDPVSRWLASLPATEQQVFNRVMVGEGGRYVVAVHTYDGNTATVGASGCLATARTQLYGNLRAAAGALSLFHLGLDLSSHFTREQIWHSRDKMWSRCMAVKGYVAPNLDTVTTKLVIPLYPGGRITADARESERKIAIATARCEASTGIIGAHLRAERLVVQSFTPADLAFFRKAIAASDGAARYSLQSRTRP